MKFPTVGTLNIDNITFGPTKKPFYFQLKGDAIVIDVPREVLMDEFEKIKDYQLGKELGKGSFGKVLDLCIKNKCDMVIKIEEYLPNQPLPVGFLREVRINEKLNKLTSDGDSLIYAEMFANWKQNRENNDTGYIVFEKMGKSIDIDILKQKGQDIMKKVHELHTKYRILHQDLTMKNITIEDDTVYFIDFGLSIDLDNESDKQLMEKKANKVDYKMLQLINYLYDYLFVFVINDMKLGDSSIKFIAEKIKIELKGKLPKDSISKNDLLSEYIFLGTYTNTAAPGGKIRPWYFQKQEILKENLCSVLRELNLLKK